MDAVAEAERAKYEQMWGHAGYRRQAPGESLVDDAVSRLGMGRGQSVIDFGCGTGRAAVRLQDRGLHVRGVDIAANCLDAGVDIPLTIACLWGLPDIVADYGYCTDVMEHIPPGKVDATLANIRRCVRKGCYFQIATRPDSMGRLIGQTLHMTVKPAAWWRECLGAWWEEVDITEGRGCLTATAR